MIDYGIGIFPIIKNLKRELSDFNHPWYADNVEALGMFARIEAYFCLLTLQGPRHSNCSEPLKGVLIVNPENPEAR